LHRRCTTCNRQRRPYLDGIGGPRFADSATWPQRRVDMTRSRRPAQFVLLLLLTLALACHAPTTSPARAETLDQWATTERATAARKLLGALGRNGAVVASPDESTPNQNYYFHWIRDAALVMNVVVSLFDHAPDVENPME